MKNRWVLFVPLAIMGLLFGAFIYRLVTPAETLIRSQWIDKPIQIVKDPFPDMGSAPEWVDLVRKELVAEKGESAVLF